MPVDARNDEKGKRKVDLLEIGELEANLPSPIDLNVRITKEISLPSLKWNNAHEVPRLMKISNSGHSAIVTAKWFGPYRPYITGSNLPGAYIFSQAHFHWGKNENEGSEHTINGVRQPLELHVMYFKTDYGTPEKALKELDGIVVLSYLYNVRKLMNSGLEPIVDVLPKVTQPYTSSAIELTALSKIAPVFADDFYMYWGSVCGKLTYRILWMIHREAQTISREQLAMFRTLLDGKKQPLLSNYRETKSINGRTVMYVNPRSMTSITLIGAPPDPPEPSEKDLNPEREGGRKKTKKGSGESKSRRKSVRRQSAGRRMSSGRRKSKKETDRLLGFSKCKESFNDYRKRIRPSRKRNYDDSGSFVTNSSSKSIENDSASFDSDRLNEKYKLLGKQRSTKIIPTTQVSNLVDSTALFTKFEQILVKLQQCSTQKKEVCLPILNELESYIGNTVKAASEFPQPSQDDFVSYRMREELKPNKKRDWALSIGRADPFDILRKYLPTKKVDPRTEDSIIYKPVVESLGAMQYAEVCAVAPPDVRELKFIALNNLASPPLPEEKPESLRTTVEVNAIPQNIQDGGVHATEHLRSRLSLPMELIQGEASMRFRREAPSGEEDEDYESTLLQLPEIIPSDLVVSLWDQDLKLVSDDAILTTHSSEDNYNEPSSMFHRSMSFIHSQDPFLIEPSKKSLTVDQLRMTPSMRQFPVRWPVIHGSRLRRQTIVTTLFQDDIPNGTRMWTSPPSVRSRIRYDRKGRKGPNSTRPKPAWRY